MTPVCVLMFLVVCAEAGMLAGKGFLCRDPDTGKLHPINSTWPSTTFCGNYHCKLRKKNTTQLEFLREINIPVDIKQEKAEKETYFDESSFFKTIKKPKENLDLVSSMNVIPVNSVVKPDVLRTIKDQISDKKDTDRYLTEDEIKGISKLLHSVKKSDLEAILEIYNLAQDVYKELDTTDPDNLIYETIQDMTAKKGEIEPQEKLQVNPFNVELKPTSYLYEPLNKLRVFDYEKHDMHTLPSNVVQITTPNLSVTPLSEPPIGKSYSHPDIQKNSFNKIIYYNPLSSFQRKYSYAHQPSEYVRQYVRIPNITPIEPKVDKFQKQIDIQSVYLPYPFTLVPRYYNWHLPQTTFSAKTRFKEAEHSAEVKSNILIRNAVLINPALEPVPAPIEPVRVNAETKEEKRVPELNKLNLKGEEKESKPVKKYDWQTDSLSKQILDEIRAHMGKPRLIKPYTLRKKINLERVGQVLKLDHANKKNKRSIEDTEVEIDLEPEFYEVHIEKTTCESDTKPGFFRYGNLNQPFPACCPQRIS